MEDKELNLVEHLEELRKRMIICLLSFIIFFIAGFIYVDDIYKWFAGDAKLLVLGPSDIMWVYFMLATVVAVTGTIPVLALQIWLFVKPALKPIERKITLTYVPVLFFLFISGLAFGYFVIFPMVYRLLVNISQGMFATNFTAERYFSFIMNMTIPFGILFEIPVVVMFLTALGIINPFVLAKIRKYAYFVLVLIAVVITPPDFMSDFVVTLPLFLLYEVSINLSKIVHRKRLKKQQQIELWEA
ncbi:twin-arginine translocase subunit TatC [Bacillus sp. BRMEA1]|uniref:twin-arginine translocase subunit TatC n=1 Tax=Neobacillus endophyticus TaxID=2738405 RepID=UPI0015675F3A|nr:twin-arginine translocase subunit TatC [Neobacillus endophyticus]NRD80479.1 twin-arginine translocase subunit TatC [Neobacillus endophyticus]